VGRKSKEARQAIEQCRRGGQRYKEYLSVTSANESINKNSQQSARTLTLNEIDDWTSEIRYEEDIENEEGLFSSLEI